MFDEAEYGASNFTAFVLKNKDVLLLDRSSFPPLVELVGATPRPQPYDDDTHVNEGYRIRPDIWKAALDYSSGTQYVWDVDSRQAIPAQGRDGEQIISTITESVQREWREAFRTKIKDTTTADEADQIELWIDKHLGASHLPDRLEKRWIDCFRDRVRNHLSQWFSDADLPLPEDLIARFQRKSSIISRETEALREFVLSVVRTMTHDELSGLMLQASAVLRLKRSWSS